MKNKLKEQLVYGIKIKIGKKYAKYSKIFKAGQIIELIKGWFEYENGLYSTDICCPSIWDTCREEYDSIYHLFGNDLEDFMDCKIIRECDE